MEWWVPDCGEEVFGLLEGGGWGCSLLLVKLLMPFFLCCLPAVLLAAKPPTLEQGRGHWAFQPLKRGGLPVVKEVGWVRTGVDAFILAGMELAGQQPLREADRATLIRRVTLDLLGLLPTPEEVAAFEQDKDPLAYEGLVERLLASPHYGERWGRHWLDLARYADTSGFHNDLERPYAWKYRDYVVRSLNEDKPYARFLLEQVAGDEVEGATEESVIATGFCRNGPSNDDNMGKTPEALAQYRADQMDDVVATTSSVFMGLTLGCARCHDHKTEPLLARDYYSMVAVFAGAERLGLPSGAKDGKDKEVKDAAGVMALVETQPVVPETHVFLRGMASRPAERVGPAVPAVLVPGVLNFPEPKVGKSSLRRRTLGEWMLGQPLVWRVAVNRVWQHHFGRGLVATPSNFGLTGERPTHPELLDWLAGRFQATGGGMKALHRLILLSATYRQRAVQEATGSLLYRGWALRRMEAEVLRDCILCASGKLNTKAGGPGFKPRIRPELLDASQRNKWPAVQVESATHWRRSVYLYVKRQLLLPSMELFDAPTTTDSCALRQQSTVPTQALVLMNDEFVETQAGYLARRAKAEAVGTGQRSVVERLFLISVSQLPGEERMQQALSFLQERQQAGDEASALQDLAHVLLNSSEFLYMD